MKKHRKKSLGYWLLYIPEHPNSLKDGYVREHRYIISEKIGRPLNKDEDVHHINGIKDDNRIENLELMTKADHTRHHHKGVPKKKFKKCIFCGKGTNSKYGLCTYHYKNQYARLKKGSISSLTEIPDIDLRKHTEETKKKLSNIAKSQPRKNGRFGGSIHDNDTNKESRG